MPTDNNFSRAVASAIAKQIMHGTRKSFGTMHADALMEINKMFNSKSSPTTTGMRVHDDENNRHPQLHEMSESEATAAGEKPLQKDTYRAHTINEGIACDDWKNSVGGPVTIKPVDRKTIEGSTPGDFRKSGDTAKPSVDAIAGLGGPRTQMPGQRDSKNYVENGKNFRPTANAVEEQN